MLHRQHDDVMSKQRSNCLAEFVRRKNRISSHGAIILFGAPRCMWHGIASTS
jgi:hypothetical protein